MITYTYKTKCDHCGKVTESDEDSMSDANCATGIKAINGAMYSLTIPPNSSEGSLPKLMDFCSAWCLIDHVKSADAVQIKQTPDLERVMEAACAVARSYKSPYVRITDVLQAINDRDGRNFAGVFTKALKELYFSGEGEPLPHDQP